MQTFYTDWLNNLQILHNDVEKTLEGLPSEALDWSPKEGVNSITALVVHLTGSQRFLVGQVIGGEDVHRDREAEFQAKGLTLDELIKRLNDNITYMTNVLEPLSLADLEDKRILRENEVSVGWILGHALKHTGIHLGHIQVMRDMWLYLSA